MQDDLNYWYIIAFQRKCFITPKLLVLLWAHKELAKACPNLVTDSADCAGIRKLAHKHPVGHTTNTVLQAYIISIYIPLLNGRTLTSIIVYEANSTYIWYINCFENGRRELIETHNEHNYKMHILWISFAGYKYHFSINSSIIIIIINIIIWRSSSNKKLLRM